MKHNFLKLFYCFFLVLACAASSLTTAVEAVELTFDSYGGTTRKLKAEDLIDVNFGYGDVTPEGYRVESSKYNRGTAFKTPPLPVFHADGFVSVSMKIKAKWVGERPSTGEVTLFRVKMAIEDGDGNVRNIYDYYYSGLTDYNTDNTKYFYITSDEGFTGSENFVNQYFFSSDEDVYMDDEITLSIERVEAGASFTIQEISIHTWPLENTQNTSDTLPFSQITDMYTGNDNYVPQPPINQTEEEYIAETEFIIDSNSRPQESAWDTGAFEYSEAGSGVESNNLPGNINFTGIRIETEEMDLGGLYKIEDRSEGSGGQIIKISGGGNGASGTAITTFTGSSGSYKIYLRYCDEDDGSGRIEVRINNNLIETFNLTNNTGWIWTPGVVATDVHINRGDTIEITGYRQGGEYARADYLEFVAPDNDIYSSF